MIKKLNFLAGIPRSGSTLLTSLLNQRPDTYASNTSNLADMLVAFEKLWQTNVTSATAKTDGTLWGWGYNYYGSIGDGSTTDRSSPVQIGSLTDWKLVGSNSYTPTAIKTDGTLWSWGRGGTGNLGDGTTANRSSPVQVGSDTDWVSFGPNNQGWFKAGAIKSP